MKNNEAVELVKRTITLKGDEDFKAEKIVDFDTYWYVSCNKASTGENSGGYAYVVDIESRIVYAVPASMPPHFNLRSVVSGDAVEATKLPKHNKKNNS